MATCLLITRSISHGDRVDNKMNKKIKRDGTRIEKIFTAIVNKRMNKCVETMVQSSSRGRKKKKRRGECNGKNDFQP